MTGFREHISQSVLDPDAVIKSAEERAKKATALLEEDSKKQAAAKGTLPEDYETKTLQEKSATILDAIDEALEGGNEPPTKQARIDDPGKSTSPETPEKAAAAQLLRVGILDDALVNHVEKHGMDGTVDVLTPLTPEKIAELNEKVAVGVREVLSRLGQGLKSHRGAILTGLGAGAAGAGAGYLGGRVEGRKDLQQYVAADQLRDIENRRRAAAFGYNQAMERIRRAFAHQQSAAKGGESA